MTGRITKIFHDRGYGFILSDTSVPHFLHAKDGMAKSFVFEQLEEQQQVEFDSVDDTSGKRNGKRAINTKPIEAARPARRRA